MDNEDLAIKVQKGFLADMPQQIETLRIFMGESDVNSAEGQAHAIKGASANIGGGRLRETGIIVTK